jgi:hypothetical protein
MVSLSLIKINWRHTMKHDEKNISEGLNQIVDIINAKGDKGELKEIVEKKDLLKSETD